MMIVLPVWLRDACVGSMAGYVSLCQVGVKLGMGGCIFEYCWCAVVCGRDCERWGVCRGFKEVKSIDSGQQSLNIPVVGRYGRKILQPRLLPGFRWKGHQVACFPRIGDNNQISRDVLQHDSYIVSSVTHPLKF